MAKTIKQTEAQFSKASLITSAAYRADVDVLNILLKDDVLYTKSEVDKLINGFKKKVINNKKVGED